MAGASPKEKFEAAVKVIQSLPKNGSFQPSHELMLRFYGYFKQATQGPCQIARPAFWDIVGKAKWDAWNKLGEMTQAQAMLSYVEELKKVMAPQIEEYTKPDIIEAMPHTEMVTEFLTKLGEFYEVVEDDPEKSPFKSLHKNKNKPQDQPMVAISLPEKRMNGDVPHEINGKLKTDRELDSSSENGEPSISQDDELLIVESITMSEALKDNSTPNVVPVLQGGKTSTPENSAAIDLQQNGLSGINDSHTNGDDTFADSGSETEEFCDTSDLPDIQSAPTEHSMLADQYIMTDALLGKIKAGKANESNNNVENGHDRLDNSGPFGSSELGDQPWSTASFTSPSSLGSVVEASSRRGGGETQGERQPVAFPRSGSSASIGSQSRGGTPGGQQPSHRGQFTAAGGAGGGQDPSFNPGPRLEVNEQIAVALVRLQQDMNSVLTRLNTLEALSVAHHQLNRSRHNSESERQQKQQVWWWPFTNMSGRTVFFIMVWPFFIHWVMHFLAKRRERVAFVDHTDLFGGMLSPPSEIWSDLRGALDELEGLVWCTLERGHPKWRRR